MDEVGTGADDGEAGATGGVPESVVRRDVVDERGVASARGGMWIGWGCTCPWVRRCHDHLGYKRKSRLRTVVQYELGAFGGRMKDH